VGFRFFRRIKILPGVTLNISKTGVSTSLGPKGAKLTLGNKGERATVGLTGTGLFYTVNRRGILPFAVKAVIFVVVLIAAAIYYLRAV
jgi:hypothetical protein